MRKQGGEPIMQVLGTLPISLAIYIGIYQVGSYQVGALAVMSNHD